MTRFEYPEDRYELNRWAVAKPPNKSVEYRFRSDIDCFQIDMFKNKKPLSVQIERKTLNLPAYGWRKTIADYLKLMRKLSKEN